VGGKGHSVFLLPPVKRPGAQCTGGYVGLSFSLDGCEKSPPNRIRFPDRPFCRESLYQLYIPPPFSSIGEVRNE